jgi:hypothetical protein
MPLPAPLLDTRDYRALVDETLARVPVHTPEWTNFNSSDPGVTLVQLFAFLTENLIFRANQIPARNRAKFLKLLGIPLRPASAARGIVTFENATGVVEAQTLAHDQQLLAGKVSYRTMQGLDVLPVEARMFTKQPMVASPEVEQYYKLLYASYDADLPADLSLYQSVAFDPAQGTLDLSATVDRTLWVAILARKSGEVEDARKAIGGRTLSLGIQPATDVEQVALPVGAAASVSTDILSFDVAKPDTNGGLAFAEGRPAPEWRSLPARADFDPLTAPGIIEIGLPPEGELKLWNNLDPLEAGVGDLPPALDDSKLADRLVTWIRVKASSAATLRLKWAGINAVAIRQFETIRAERLADGDGMPDQVRQLARHPVLENSVAISTIATDGSELSWSAIDDLLAAAPEVPVYGNTQILAPATSFRVDPEAGVITFGDGLAGQRPGSEHRIYVRYEYCEGLEGNVNAGALTAGPLVPPMLKATNPIATWGGADAEDVTDGERQIQRFLQHRDRLVTEADFRSIAWRTPGVAIGRIDVLPAWHPDLAPTAVGSVPGVVTVLAAPRYDVVHPQAPRADRTFLDALCRYLDPRRLVTTELILRGPIYKGLWISVGIEVAGGVSIAETVDAVKAQLCAYLSPLPVSSDFASTEVPLYGPETDPALRGWPLGRAVHARALLAEAARVPGVVEVADVLLSFGGGPAVLSVEMNGIELPEILGISVVSGDPVDLAALRGDKGSSTPSTGPASLPIPVVAETC